MLVITTLLSMVLGGAFGNATLASWLVAALGAVSAAWYVTRAPRGALHAYVNLEPDAPDGATLQGALTQAVQRLRHTQSTLVMRITAPMTTAQGHITLELDRNLDLRILQLNQRPRLLNHPGVWIADHPLPLVLPPTHSLTLLMRSTHGGRIRVLCGATAALPPCLWIGGAILVVAACLSGCSLLLIGCVSFLSQAAMLTYCARRFDNQGEV